LFISEDKSKEWLLHILHKHSRILYAALASLSFVWSSPSFLYEEMVEKTDWTNWIMLNSSSEGINFHVKSDEQLNRVVMLGTRSS
jgi:hypothetical protein